MKKFLSIQYTDLAFNIAMFFLRAGAGAMLMMHGYDKVVHFSQYKKIFLDFLHLGPTLGLLLVIFAELVCGFFVLIGLFARLAVIPLVISMAVALFRAHHGDVFGDGEKDMIFLLSFVAILLVGPGKASIDGLRK
jgi:putative oxidoreductase